MKKTLLLLSLMAVIAAILLTSSPCHPVPKNIILFVGDGMGVQQITAAKVIKGSLAMERCPVTGLVTTWPANGFVTDSAAGATAMATGVKVKNGAVSLDAEGQPLKTVLEELETTVRFLPCK